MKKKFHQRKGHSTQAETLYSERGDLIESGALKINSVGSLLENASTQDMNKCKKPVNFNGYS